MERDKDAKETENQDFQTDVVKATFFIEKIILVSKKKIGQDEIKYLQVQN